MAKKPNAPKTWLLTVKMTEAQQKTADQLVETIPHSTYSILVRMGFEELCKKYGKTWPKDTE